MMSSEQIRSHAEQHERTARRNKREPLHLSALGIDAIHRAHIPFLGDYIPKGYERMHVGRDFGDRYGYGTTDHEFLFVDSSGFGARGELAMTLDQFAEFTQRNPGYAYAVVESGQFQVVVGVYRRRLVKAKRAA